MSQSSQSPVVHSLLSPVTGTWQYLVADPNTGNAALIGVFFDFDTESSVFRAVSADELFELVRVYRYNVTHILEMGGHRDAPTASRYIQNQLTSHGLPRPEICTSRQAMKARHSRRGTYRVDPTATSNSYDRYFEDEERFFIGKLQCSAVCLPSIGGGSTAFVIGDKVFSGDGTTDANSWSLDTDSISDVATETNLSRVCSSNQLVRSISSFSSSASLTSYLCPRLTAGISKTLFHI